MGLLLEDKVVVVSGVGPGLGREIAAAALRDGAAVMMGARREDNLRAIATDLDAEGTHVGWRRTDITDVDDCQALVDAAAERFGGIDALVNCAAYDSLLGGLEGADLGQWRQVLETNVIGTMQMCSAVVPHMKARGGGSIVMIGSQSSYWPQFLQTIYAASKGALTSAMYYLAKELGPYRIRVNTVVPTWMWGPPVEGYIGYMVTSQGITEEEAIGTITRNMPLAEIPSDGDVAEAVVFFASDRARMITAQALMVNSGEFPH
jgi:NAD(P)-dependent dehydrogenase (short-subunit alcohol dehydrogenase family)